MTAPLASSNDRVKQLRRLSSRRRARSDERAFVVDGPVLVAEALRTAAAGGPAVREIFVGPDTDPVLDRLAEALAVPVHPVAGGVLERVLDPVNPRPVAAIVDRPSATISDLGVAGAVSGGAAAGTGVVLCLVDARDPGNLGTLIRSAEASGAAGLVLAGTSVDPTSPKVVRASAGSVLRLPVVEHADTLGAVDALRAGCRQVVATVPSGQAIAYDEVRLVDAAILLGNEAHGLPDAVLAGADVTTTIPLAGPTESLNLAVAGSLLCFEALRQARAVGVAPPRRDGGIAP